MKLRAILSKTTTDKIKSRILSSDVAELVYDVYLKPSEFAEIIEKYEDKEFILEVKEK